MKVNQALILAGGHGSRMGLGIKSLLLYKDKIMLEYLVESCVKAGIKNIVIAFVPKSMEGDIPKEKIRALNGLVKKYPVVKLVRDINEKLREAPEQLRSFLDQNKPFFIMCGQSPQLPSHLKTMSKIYKNGSIVTSGYEARRELKMISGKVKSDQILAFKRHSFKKLRNFVIPKGELITHFPYIIDYNFYDNYVKADNYKEMFEFCPEKYLSDKKTVFCVKNEISISEIDYKEDLFKLHKSVDKVLNSYPSRGGQALTPTR